ncbi:heme exporter protein CcmB [Oligoflexia bacterium]|nr:heme exporter protein CcmB [Oligoflexia bacterium]
MKPFWALIKKDLALEFRTKETFVLMLTLSLLLAVVVSCGVSSAFLDAATVEKCFPVFVWLTFIFSATVSIGRSYEYELEHMGIEGLIQAGASAYQIYFSKVLSNFSIVFVGHCFTVCALSVLLDVEVLPILAELMLLSVFVIAAYSALSTILAAMSSTSRLKNMLLPLILLPLLFPIFFGALETTSHLLAYKSIDFQSLWFSLLIGLNVVYIVLGINLYDFVIKE